MDLALPAFETGDRTLDLWIEDAGARVVVCGLDGEGVPSPTLPADSRGRFFPPSSGPCKQGRAL